MIWHRHKWTDWAITDKGAIYYYRDKVGWFVVQERRCHVCGKTQFDEQAKYNGAPDWACKRVSEATRSPRKDGVPA